jgi:hypothetical protein
MEKMHFVLSVYFLRELILEKTKANLTRRKQFRSPPLLSHPPAAVFKNPSDPCPWDAATQLDGTSRWDPFKAWLSRPACAISSIPYSSAPENPPITSEHIVQLFAHFSF